MGDDGKVKEDPENPLPPQPFVLAAARQMDFSPLRPDVWVNTDSERWNYYIQIRLAFEDGRDEVKAGKKEAAEKKRKKAEVDRKAAEYYKKHQGATF